MTLLGNIKTTPLLRSNVMECIILQSSIKQQQGSALLRGPLVFKEAKAQNTKTIANSWHKDIFPAGRPASIVTPAPFHCQVRDG